MTTASTSENTNTESIEPTVPAGAVATESADAGENLPPPTGSREQFHRFLPVAQAIAAAGVRAARVDVGRVVRNAAKGAAAVLARRADLAAVPLISIDKITSLTPMGEALAFAAGMVEKFVPIVGDTRAVIDQGQKLRAKLLTKADGLVVDGIVPAETVRGIRKGQGFRDMASDLVALADLFQRYAAPARKSTIVDAADLEAADTLGRRLLATLHVPGEKRAVAPELTAASEARDRLWTLFEQTWEENVWRAGSYLFLRDVELHVPLLMSGHRSKHATPTPTPAPPTTTAPAVAP